MMAGSKGHIIIVEEPLDHKDGYTYAVSDNDAEGAAKLEEPENLDIENMIRVHMDKRKKKR